MDAPVTIAPSDLATLTVDELMRAWPEVIKVFIDFRMLCVGCPIAPYHTLDDACHEHGLERDKVLAAVEAVVAGRPPRRE